MFQSNPIDMLDPRLRLIGFVVVLLFSFFMLWKMAPYNSALAVGDIQKPILSFELGGTVKSAQHLIDTWKEYALIDVAIDSIRDDFLFIVAYVGGISYGLFWLASAVDGAAAPWLLKGLLWLGWAQPLAGVLDLIENFALLKMLKALKATAPWPQIAMICAYPKFLIALGGLAVLFLTAVGALIWPRYFHR